MPIILTQSIDKQNIKDNFDCNNDIILTIAFNDNVGFDSCVFCLREDGLIGDDADFLFYNSKKRWKALDYNKVIEGNQENFDKNKYSNKRRWFDCTIPVSSDNSIIGPIEEYIADSFDDEALKESYCISLNKIDKNVRDIVFCLFLYNAESFSRSYYIENIRVQILDYSSKRLLTSIPLSQNFRNTSAMEICKLKRNADDIWLLETLGEPVGGGIQELVDKYA